MGNSTCWASNEGLSLNLQHPHKNPGIADVPRTPASRGGGSRFQKPTGQPT